ncbi:MAG: SRPBCC family protein [Chloroflexota bacterium]
MREHTERTFEVEASPAKVWELLADLRKLVAYTEPRTVVRMDGKEAPIRVGTKFHLTTKSGLKSDFTVLRYIPSKEVNYRIDLGVWDGGVSIMRLEPVADRTKVTFLTPCVRWIGAWGIVQRATWPLVLMEAKKTCDRFEDAVRRHVAGEPPTT